MKTHSSPAMYETPPIEGRTGGVSLFRALLLISGALTLIGASPGSQARLLGADKPAVGATDAHPASAPKERELQPSLQTKYEDYDYSKYFREVGKPLFGRGWGGLIFYYSRIDFQRHGTTRGHRQPPTRECLPPAARARERTSRPHTQGMG